MISDRTYGETTSFSARKLASCVQFQFKPERFVGAVSVENFIAEQDTKRCKCNAVQDIPRTTKNKMLEIWKERGGRF